MSVPNSSVIHPLCVFSGGPSNILALATLKASSTATKPPNIFWQLLSGADIVLTVAIASFVRRMKECFTDTSSCFSEVLLCNISDSLLKSCTFAIGSSPWSPAHTDRWVEMRSSLPLNHDKQRKSAEWGMWSKIMRKCFCAHLIVTDCVKIRSESKQCWSQISCVFWTVRIKKRLKKRE